MKTKEIKIAVRTKDGWTTASNKSKDHCDGCGETLWVSPSGDKYCNGNWVKCEAAQ